MEALTIVKPAPDQRHDVRHRFRRLGRIGFERERALRGLDDDHRRAGGLRRQPRRRRPQAAKDKRRGTDRTHRGHTATLFMVLFPT